MSACDAQFKKAVSLRMYDAFEAAGFTRFRKEAVDWPLHDGFHAWVGLNTALSPDRVDITPNVGVHVVPLHKLCTVAGGRYPYKYSRSHATYAINIGMLEAVGDERAFAFAPHQSEGFIDAECRRLAHIYATAGLDYARSIASYEALLPLLQERVEGLGLYPEMVASCLYLMGRKQEARDFVEGFVARHKDYFEGFAIPFLAKLEEEAPPRTR
jgi:hypothetical protein